MKIAILLTSTVRPQVSDSNFSVVYRKDTACSFRFLHQVQFGGQSGDACFDEHYASVRNRVKNKLRSLLRILFPGVWF